MIGYLRLLISFGLVAGSPAYASEAAPTLQFENGLWFNGSSFEPRTVFSDKGRLSFSPPESVSRVIDLSGYRVIPPLCEAHNHNLGGEESEIGIINKYLQAGIYYVNLLSNLPYYTGQSLTKFNRPDSVDVQFANGGITSPDAHPIPLRERLLGYGAYPGFTKEMLADHAYFAVASTEDIETKWPIILSYRPDFIKIFLLYSEKYDANNQSIYQEIVPGLDPALVPVLVEKAHAHDLRVFAHVETALDFHVAVAAGVDVIAHLPGDSVVARIDPIDAHLAAENDVIVITTANLATRHAKNPALYSEIRAAQVHNLSLLRDADVTLAIGSDQYNADSRLEIEYLQGLGVFTPSELLNMWTRNCAVSIFPDRAIGTLDENAEASFLVLDGNPLDDWTALNRIKLRIKDGRILELADTDGTSELQ